MDNRPTARQLRHWRRARLYCLPQHGTHKMSAPRGRRDVRECLRCGWMSLSDVMKDAYLDLVVDTLNRSRNLPSIANFNGDTPFTNILDRSRTCQPIAMLRDDPGP